jgi:hypothetical protein
MDPCRENISDGVNEWNPATMNLFHDDCSLQLGTTYYYRVIAKARKWSL